MEKKKLVVLSGAGISAESGIPTFRDSNGLWEGHDITKVATYDGWLANPALVLEFYNQRRKNIMEAKPNDGHKVLAELEAYFDVLIITQNIDNLHEHAGSTNVLHLHGEICKARSTVDENLVYQIDGWELKIGDLCEKGSQLRPHIVWFGEMVPKMEEAAFEAIGADIFVVVGTSLVVYPAASLIDYVPVHSPKFVVDPKLPDMKGKRNLTLIQDKASTGLRKVARDLIAKHT